MHKNWRESDQITGFAKYLDLGHTHSFVILLQSTLHQFDVVAHISWREWKSVYESAVSLQVQSKKDWEFLISTRLEVQ